MKYILFSVVLIVSILLFGNNDTVLSNNVIQGRLNNLNGTASECVMHEFYTKTGWIKIEGEVGRTGIDGLYYKMKNGVIREVLVAESKWNKSGLSKSGKNKLVKQMSQEWIIRSLNKLQKYKPLPKYKTIKYLVEKGQYRARLFKIKPIGNESIKIFIYKIKNKGNKSFEKFIENELKPISLHKPKNSFEQRVIHAYNSCRKKSLHYYFPMLESEDIDKLLLDNYLQKKDIKDYL